MEKIEKSVTSSSDSLAMVEMGSLGISSPLVRPIGPDLNFEGGSGVQSDSTDICGKTSDTAISSRGPSVIDYPSILNADNLKILRQTYLIPLSYRMLVLDSTVRILTI